MNLKVSLIKIFSNNVIWNMLTIVFNIICVVLTLVLLSYLNSDYSPWLIMLSLVGFIDLLRYEDEARMSILRKRENILNEN